MRYLAALLFLSCGPWNFKQFNTACGMNYLGDGAGNDVPGFTRERINTLESWAIEAGLATCEKLKGYNILIRPGGVWRLHEDEYFRSGSTYCNDIFPRIEVAAPFFGIGGNSIIHEMHHVQQRCAPPMPIDPGMNLYHSDWIRSKAGFKINELDVRVIEWGRSLGIEPYLVPEDPRNAESP